MDYQFHQMMPAEAQLQPIHEHSPARANVGTVHTVTVRDGVIAEQVNQTTEKARSSEASPFFGTEGIFSTARNKNGSPAMSIGDDTLLTMPDGTQATAKTLASIGAITRNPDGSYSEKAAGETGGEDEAPPSEEDFVKIPEEVMNDVVNAALDPLPQEMLNGFAAAGVAAAVGKGDLAGLVSKFAKEAGGSFEDAQARVEALAHVYKVQTMKALAKHGIDKAEAEKFFDWARANKQGQMAEAISYQLHEHNVSRWAPLARQYMSQVAPSVGALKAAGIPTRASHHKAGEVECFVAKAGAGWMSIKAAARAGYL